MLSPEATVNRVTNDVGNNLRTKGIPDTDVESFTREHVRIYQVGGVDVTLIDEEWTEAVNPVIKALVGSPRTRACVIEYFDPELLVNIQTTPIVGKQLTNLYQTQQKTRRIQHSNDLAKIAQDSRKPVAVADIANRPAYLAHHLTPLLLALASSFASEIPSFQYLLISASAYLSGSMHLNQRALNTRHIQGFEKFLLDPEDARRLFVAEGLRKLASLYSQSPKYKATVDNYETPQIVVVYPQAHAKRIAHYLENPTLIDRASTKAKKVLYGLMPGLDFEVRIWEWKDILARATNNPLLAGWQKTSTIPIRF